MEYPNSRRLGQCTHRLSAFLEAGRRFVDVTRGVGKAGYAAGQGCVDGGLVESGIGGRCEGVVRANIRGRRPRRARRQESIV